MKRRNAYASALAALAVVVLVFVAVDFIPGAIRKLDATPDRLFTLSGEGKAALAAIDEEVRLYLLSDAAQIDQWTLAALERIAASNANIRLRVLSGEIGEQFARQYGAEGMPSGSVIVESARRSAVVSAEEIYQYDYQYNAYTQGYVPVDARFCAEGALISAVQYVARGDMPAIYTYGAVNGEALPGGFQRAVMEANYELVVLEAQEPMPADAAALLIYAPAKDLDEPAARGAAAYLAAGGCMVLLTDYKTAPLARLDALTANYGLTAQRGVVLEGDAARHVQDYPQYLLPLVGQHEWLNGQAVYTAPLAHGIKLESAGRDGLTAQSLLATSPSAYLKLDSAELKSFDKADGDEEGPFALAALAQRAGGGTVVWAASTQMLYDQVDGQTMGANSQLIASALTSRYGAVSGFRKEGISLTGEPLAVDGRKGALTAALVGLPALLLLVGVVLSRRGRRRAKER